MLATTGSGGPAAATTGGGGFAVMGAYGIVGLRLGITDNFPGMPDADGGPGSREDVASGNDKLEYEELATSDVDAAQRGKEVARGEDTALAVIGGGIPEPEGTGYKASGTATIGCESAGRATTGGEEDWPAACLGWETFLTRLAASVRSVDDLAEGTALFSAA